MRLPHLIAVTAFATPTVANADGNEFFERKVRPLLVQKCQSCHDDKKAKGRLQDEVEKIHDPEAVHVPQ